MELEAVVKAGPGPYLGKLFMPTLPGHGSIDGSRGDTIAGGGQKQRVSAAAGLWRGVM